MVQANEMAWTADDTYTQHAMKPGEIDGSLGATGKLVT